MKENTQGSGIRILAVSAAVFLLSALVCGLGAAGMWDIKASDWLNQKESVTDKNIYIIGIDDRTLEEYGPVASWSRDIPARLVEILNADEGARPAVI